MLSVKWIEDFGHQKNESIFAAESVRYIPEDSYGKRDHLVEIWNNDKVTERFEHGIIYVMGDGGATVAKYNLDVFGPSGRPSLDKAIPDPLPPQETPFHS